MIILIYPNNIKKTYCKNDNHANRGMDLESLIDEANKYYIEQDIAYIYKKPTPVGVVKVKYNEFGKKITDAYFKMPSTLDFNGLYKGHYIEFDAKKTTKKTNFPISNVHPHQIKHIRNILKHGGITFLIIMINNEYFLLTGDNFLKFIDENERKSIPYEYLCEHAFLLSYNYLKGLDYLKVVDTLIGGK